jgi:hypothetical protein
MEVNVPIHSPVTFLIISRSVFLFFKWETFLTKVADSIKTHISCSKLFFENRAVYKITWTNVDAVGREATVLDTNDTDVHAEYAVFIVFTLQQRLQKRALR